MNFLPSIINHDQYAYVKDRTIGDAVRCLATNVLPWYKIGKIYPQLGLFAEKQKNSCTLPLHQEILGISYKMGGQPGYQNRTSFW